MISPTWPDSFDGLLRRHLPFCGEDEQIGANRMLADLGLDSLKTVSLIIALEDAYGLTFPDEILADATFATAGALWEATQTAAQGQAINITE
ncbi:phosphopantetheine-binding protein [Streptacidiphilus sp. P02-A3a]|uniref:phosphopantetheine-binding protein n=1 Tax=Streptacidiphilus sp. P02-A3a TaxID=2704468 RepID=UPI0015F9E0AE|nr:phosphopantetheine-binding protein [Streptacidiphilus sp. P02-A3a]QMU71818.1 acyl carrier protein [Streptacidiphilus sp. P02-A3a]